MEFHIPIIRFVQFCSDSSRMIGDFGSQIVTMPSKAGAKRALRQLPRIGVSPGLA